jgi:glycosyltransferase involved in cell wall biosynthesis
MYSSKDLTFVICAYGDNQNLPYLIESLKKQTVKTNILISTPTPSDYLRHIAKKNSINIYENNEANGIGADWNYGYSMADSKLITIAHQDDIYESTYAEQVIENANRAKDPVIIYTDYYEIRNGIRVDNNKILSVKRKMNSVFKSKLFRSSRFMKRRVLSLGSPICCPSVTYNRELCGSMPFNTEYKNSCDYQTFINLANIHGAFVYIPQLLMGHRISADSTTTKNLASNIRQKEDQEIFEEFWPKWIAQLIYRAYSTSENSNDLK